MISEDDMLVDDETLKFLNLIANSKSGNLRHLLDLIGAELSSFQKFLAETGRDQSAVASLDIPVIATNRISIEQKLANESSISIRIRASERTACGDFAALLQNFLQRKNPRIKLKLILNYRGDKHINAELRVREGSEQILFSVLSSVHEALQRSGTQFPEAIYAIDVNLIGRESVGQGATDRNTISYLHWSARPDSKTRGVWIEFQRDLKNSVKELIEWSPKLEVERSASVLSRRESSLLSHYFGLRRLQSMSLRDIAHKFKISQEEASAIKDTAIRKLRNKTKSKILRAYLAPTAEEE